MFTNLFSYLKHEQQLLRELVLLAERQQKALIKFDIKELNKVTSEQNELSKSLKEAETHRIETLMKIFRISRKDAASITLSSLEKHYETEDLNELRKLRLELRALTSKLQAQNSMNRVLANRAKMSVGEILNMFTNGSKHICNIKV
jgi:flagellar biosynthesis/type III secretory pathway chaperone